jgi:hypothetical protein
MDSNGLCLDSKLELSLCVNRNIFSAAHYFKMSADLGDSTGLCRYGSVLGVGLGVHIDFASGARYLKLSADLGAANPQYEFGSCLASGQGPERDPVAAERAFRAALESGDPVHIWQFATRLLKGDGIAKDDDAARDCCLLLESSTNVDRLSRLVLMLRCGWKVRMDIAGKNSLRWHR